jgi:serine protease AprX
LADVWLALAGSGPEKRVDVLVNPHNKVGVGGLLRAIRAELSRPDNRLAYNESHVVVRVNLEEVLTLLLPQSRWWQRVTHRGNANEAQNLLGKLTVKANLTFEQWYESTEKVVRPAHPADRDLLHLARIAVAVIVSRDARDVANIRGADFSAAVRTVRRFLARALEGVPEHPTLWTISRNRSAVPCLWRSRETVKADAAIRVFNVKCDQICWGVIDTGIDAGHPAFVRHNRNNSESSCRILKTYDFSRLRVLLTTQPDDSTSANLPWLAHLKPDDRRLITTDLRERLLEGLQIDWDMIAPALEVPHDFELDSEGKTSRRTKPTKARRKPAAKYEPPQSDHGTHVAGIIGADWRKANVETADVIVKDVYDLVNLQQLNASQVLRGVCPDIQLYDLRVFDPKGNDGDEFAILAALQFVRHLNSSKSKRVIHGVNISISLEHDVRSYACGRTPVCDECDRAVGSGLVVVAAAGNAGYDEQEIAFTSSYRQSSITDPGNADTVITVGSTHREMPHTYGVSYFSSRGPTGDGRAKPDLVAPGERIFSSVPNKLGATLDGTSMAAPHVSGAAALLMARHSELIGQTAMIKKILCSTATDLGRVVQYQGSGLLDILRALESV